MTRSGRYAQAFSHGFAQQRATREREEEEARIKKEAKRSKEFNPANALTSAITAMMAAGGPTTPTGWVAGVGGAISSKRGQDFDPVGSAVQGGAQGMMAGAMGGTPTGNFYDDAMQLGSNMINPENMGQTSMYLNSMQSPEHAIQSLGQTGQIRQQQQQAQQQQLRQNKDDLYKSFSASLKVREPFIKKLLDAGKIESAQKAMNDLIESNPEYNQIMDVIGDLPVGDGDFSVDRLINIFRGTNEDDGQEWTFGATSDGRSIPLRPTHQQEPGSGSGDSGSPEVSSQIYGGEVLANLNRTLREIRSREEFEVIEGPVMKKALSALRSGQLSRTDFDRVRSVLEKSQWAY